MAAKKSLMASRMNQTNATEKVLSSQKDQETSYTEKKPAKIRQTKEPKQRKPFFKKREKTLYQLPSEKQKQEDTPFSYEEFESELNAEATQKTNRSEMNAVAKKRLTVWAQAVIIILSIYTCFLIYGLFLTNYIYDSSGNVAPEVLSVSDLRTLNDYKNIEAFYLRARILYEKTLELDYELSQKPDEALVISMGYTELLETVDKLVIDMNAAQFDARYTAIYSQLTTWTSTDIAVYLQYMAKAIANNDATAANNAIIARDTVYNDFALMTSNIAKLASTIKGTGKLDLYQWTPDTYIDSLMKEE